MASDGIPNMDKLDEASKVWEILQLACPWLTGHITLQIEGAVGIHKQGKLERAAADDDTRIHFHVLG